MNKQKVIRRLSTALILCATLATTTGLAHAGACTDQIAQLRQAPKEGLKPDSESLGQGRSYRQLMFSADVERASALDLLGHEEECLLAVHGAKLDLQESS
jgi:hypothetical protein